MNIYVFGMFFTLFFNAVVKHCNSLDNKRKKDFMFLSALIIWGGIMAFRGTSVGTDTGNYKQLFLETASAGWSELPATFMFQRCPVYAVYSKLVGMISMNPQMIVAMNAFVYMIGMLLFLYHNSSEYGISIYCLLSFHDYFYAMNATRLSLAVMLVMWSYHFGIRNKKKKSISLLIIAILTHSSAVIGAGVTIVSLIKLNRKFTYMFLTAVVIIMPLLRQIAVIFTYFFPAYASYTSASNGWNSIYYEGGGGGRRALIALFLFAIFSVCLIWKTRFKIRSTDDEIFWRLFFLSMIAILSMIVWRKVYIFARLEYYFNYFFLVFIPYCTEHFFNQKSKRVVYLTVIAVMFVPFYVKLADYLPYITFFAEN